MKIVIEVTQNDIDRGVPGSCTSCPIAWAARRTLGAKRVEVDSRLTVCDDGIKIYSLPLKAQNFVTRFDNLDPVVPFSFKVKI